MTIYLTVYHLFDPFIFNEEQINKTRRDFVNSTLFVESVISTSSIVEVIWQPVHDKLVEFSEETLFVGCTY